MIYGEATLPEVVASENFRTGDFFALFEELTKKRFSSGYDNLNFGEEGPNDPPPRPEIESRFAGMFEKRIRETYAEVRSAQTEFLVEMIASMWHVPADVTATETSVRSAGFDAKTATEPDIYDIS